LENLRRIKGDVILVTWILLIICVITEISSATLHGNGYKNVTMPTNISSPATPKSISKGKNYTNGKKLACANSLKEVCAQCAGQ
jgi:hypothetical protein